MTDSYVESQGKIRRQIIEIAEWPAEQLAVEWLKRLGEYSEPEAIGIPATLQLLIWAVEVGPEQFGLDNHPADAVENDLLYWSGMGHVMKAVFMLLNVDDPNEEIPGEMIADSPEKICWGMIDLANHAHA